MKKGGILLVLDTPNRHTPAMQRAFDLSRRMRAPVHVLLEAFDPLVQRAEDEFAADAGEARRQLLAERRTWLRALLAAWVRDGLEATGEVRWSPSPWRTAVERAWARSPAFVVKDWSPRTGARRLAFPVLDFKLIQYCPAPLLLVHPRSQHLPERILAAVDVLGTQDSFSDELARAARHLGSVTGAQVRLAHSFAFSQPPYDPLRLYPRLRRDDARRFSRFARRHGVAKGLQHLIEGVPARGLAALVRSQDIDLLIAGSMQHSLAERLLVGSTAQDLARDMPCDLLVLKPRGVKARVERELKLRSPARGR